MRTAAIKKSALKTPPRELPKVLFETIKTGIIKSNLIAMFAGLSMALYIYDIRFFDKIGEIVLAALGSALVIGAAGAFNNLYDRDIDAIMDRTKNRPTVTGQIQPKTTLAIGVIMALLGLGCLLTASPLAALFGFLGLFLYVVPYTMWTKRRTIYNTEVGSFSGAVPPLIGWTAVSPDLLHPGAAALFILMLLWQMPHFYAIAIRRHDEYKAANVPMLPVVKGTRRTYLQTNVYIAALVCASFLFWSFSPIIAVVALLLSAGWLILSIAGYKKMTPHKWATVMFIYSLNHITVLFAVIIGYSLIRTWF
ncbi:protoheme IX farnesyltransferase [Paenibacillus hemerocallicola]|uniref:Protoheme IX farnesyltransferase n=1 Tax=Paenibacillus hemerocallicola TaxID=1172614 RepID=A0A5C4T7T4_9BACL|nr:heme o synthase [Paenibacillus hemerocallicola]TNJ64856.1 protoheme IX farnesyltransferase [Paenibacillus hemerocallicola]